MKHDRSSDDSVLEGQRAHLIILALVAILGLFPPETRSESMAGSAVLVALFAVLFWPRRLILVHVLPLLLLVPVSFALTLMAQAPGGTVQPLVVAFLALAAGLSAFSIPKDVRCQLALPRVLACVGAVVSIYALYQRFHGLEALASFLEHAQLADRDLLLDRARGGRAFAGFATPAALGGYLGLCLPVCVAAGIGGKGRTRWLLWVSAALQVAGMLVAASATAVAGLVLALVLAVWRWKGLRRPLVLSAAALLLLLGAVFVIRGGEVTGILERQSPWTLRARNYRVATEVTVDHPWVGVGPAGFGEVYPQYRRRGDNETRHVHDLPLEMTAELGLPLGLATSAIFYALFLLPLFRRTVDSPIWWSGMQIGLAAFAFQNLADFTAFLPSVLWTAAIMRGWIARRDLRAGTAPTRPAVLSVALATLLVAALAVLGGLASKDRRAARNALAREQPEVALERAERATTLAPWDPDGWLILSRALIERSGPLVPGNRDPAIRTALQALDRAVDLSPVRPSARDFRARVRFALDDRPGAYADASRAAALYPNEPRYAELREQMRSMLPRPPGDPGTVP